MASPPLSKELFLKKLQEIVESNLSNPQFGVSQLAEEVGMSRVTLYRKIKIYTNNSASKFICKTRLDFAIKLLQQNNETVTEIAAMVGFGSVTYFIKCFHDYYGLPPGELQKNMLSDLNYHSSYLKYKKLIIRQKIQFWLFLLIVFILLFFTVLQYFKHF